LGDPVSPVEPLAETYDVLRYDLALEVTLSGLSGGVLGTMTMEARSLQENLTHVVLDLDSVLRCTGVSDAGVETSFVHAQNQLRVTFTEPKAFDEPFTVVVHYRGEPPRRGFGSFAVYQHDGVPIVQTLSEPGFAHTWWPCKDRPNDKALVSLHYTVPPGMVAAANGVLTSVEPLAAGRTTYHWESRYPISTYLVSLAATNYVTIEDTYSSGTKAMPLTHYVFPEDLASAEIAFARTPEMIAAFAARFGEYPFIEEKYGMAEFLFAGAMEHQTLTSYGQGLVLSPNDLIVAHELAHQWWGDCVTLEHFRNIWLNEGFATYGEALWLEASEGRAAYLEFFDERAHIPFAGPVYDPDPSQLFTSTTYIKGAFVLHMLRGVVGDSKFYDILRAYHAAHAYDNASTRVFIEIAEAVAAVDLEWFFAQWLRRDDRPAYEMTWSSPPVGPGAGSVTIDIRQLQEGELYRMPVPVRIHGPSGITPIVLEVAARSETFIVSVPTPVDSIELDPEGWVLKWIGPPPESVASLDSGGSAAERLRSWASPNPFDVFTRIHLAGAWSVERTVLVFDASGRQRTSLRVDPGADAVRWDGADDAGVRLPPGVYLYEVGGSAESGKVVVR
jgi:aminopeptidase N